MSCGSPRKGPECGVAYAKGVDFPTTATDLWLGRLVASELDLGRPGAEEKKGDGGSRDRRGVFVQTATCASAPVSAFSPGEEEDVTRRRLSLPMETLCAREDACGADECLTGELFKRRFEEVLGGGSASTDAETVRLRPGRCG